ncbi:hypothetical protein Tco_0188891 [Tanacetum coccineum]
MMAGFLVQQVSGEDKGKIMRRYYGDSDHEWTRGDVVALSLKMGSFESSYDAGKGIQCQVLVGFLSTTQAAFCWPTFILLWYLNGDLRGWYLNSTGKT